MEIIILLIILCTSIWVLVDAKKIGVKKGQINRQEFVGCIWFRSHPSMCSYNLGTECCQLT